MMDRIDFELCIDVDQYAATSLQHNINPTKVDDYDYEASSTVPRIRTRHHDEVDSANNTSEDDDSHPPRKRTRFLGADDRREVSLDEAYNETENASEYQDLIHGHNQAMGSGTSHENQSSHSSHDIVNSYPDIDMAMETDQNNDEPTQRLGLTSLQHEGPGPSPIRSTITTGGFSTGSSHPSNRFTIYEDPDYMDIDGSNPETSCNKPDPHGGKNRVLHHLPRQLLYIMKKQGWAVSLTMVMWFLNVIIEVLSLKMLKL
ncbi:hypothetical protein EYZ11_003363 [Aspergillus tanneri]|uniref:Uncharacterized protein n=1 Tax=Aspergillus tanneri TaxID=1220188 RepID=A0A4S3JQL7_9EURO|nr:hypothetical protein EYZ11_003363 [Aspergillus tanneri]